MLLKLNLKAKNQVRKDQDVDESEDKMKVLPVPEHVDHTVAHPDIKKGILGFRYETKNETIVVYTSPAAKTFCMLMKLKPI